MDRRIPMCVLALLFLFSSAFAAQPLTAAVRPVTDDYFAKRVVDPYRYFEDLALPEVQAWAKTQNDYARGVLASIPGRTRLLARIEELENSVPARVTEVRRLPSDLYFYEKRGVGDDQFKLYLRRGLKGKEILLVDPEVLAKAKGKPYAINYYEPSRSGRMVAYGISEAGSEDAEIHVLDVANRKEIIKPISRGEYGGISWLDDDSGFFYLRMQELKPGMPKTEKYRSIKVWFHPMDQTQADTLVLAPEKPKGVKLNPDENPNLVTVPGEKRAFAMVINGVQPEFAMYIAPSVEAVLAAPAPWRLLFDASADVTSFAIHGDDLYVLTHKNAQRFKILKTSLSAPDLDHAEVVVAAGHQVVVDLAAAEDALYVQTRDGSISHLLRVAYTQGAKPESIALPVEGALTLTATDVRVPGTLIDLGTWIQDNQIYAVGKVGQAIEDTGLQPRGRFGAPANLESHEVMVRSWDGVMVPLSIVSEKSIKLNGQNPTLLYGYGAYGITTDPIYLPRLMAWYERGGIRATCHVRGGGAYGEEWHLAGKLDTKPNTWKDAIACAQYLIAHGYTSPARLAIYGGSAGGIMVGRAITERPELFAAAIPQVGSLNPLRAETTPNGIPNIPEFGSFKTRQGFEALYAMDSYLHVKDGVPYPAILLTAGMNDPRVDPWESMKMAARLEAATTSGKPVLLRLEYEAGHGIGSTKKQRNAETADIYSFAFWQLGQPDFQPKHERVPVSSAFQKDGMPESPGPQ